MNVARGGANTARYGGFKYAPWKRNFSKQL